jgi:siroheme synthase (precorrin-2 oxidase/ferrochelatase)
MGLPSAQTDLSDGLIAVIGSSAPAMASLQALRSAGANVRWYCRDLDVASTVLLASAPPGRLELSFADPLEADYRDFTAIVSDAGNALDSAVAERALAENVPINVVGKPARSNFTLPTPASWFGARRRKSQEIAA